MSALRGVVTALLAAAREGEEEVCTNNPLTLTLRKSLPRSELELLPPWLVLQVIFKSISTMLPQYYERSSALIF